MTIGLLMTSSSQLFTLIADIVCEHTKLLHSNVVFRSSASFELSSSAWLPLFFKTLFDDSLCAVSHRTCVLFFMRVYKLNISVKLVNSSRFKLYSNKKSPGRRSELADLIFDICSGCQKADMSAIPQGAFAARKVHQNMEKAFVWENNLKMAKDPEGKKYDRAKGPQYTRVGQTALELSPLKYNSKLMNSIWGLYNRYSVHNFKKNTDGKAFVAFGEHQLHAAVSQLPGNSNFVPVSGNKL